MSTMNKQALRRPSLENASSSEDVHSDASSPPASSPTTPDSTASRPPTLRSPANGDTPTMTSSSTPLGPTNAARRPPPAVSRASGLSSDIQAKMKAFSLSRQGAPRPGGSGQPSTTASGPLGGFPTGPISGATSPPAAPLPGGLRIPQGLQRPNVPSFNSTPSPIASSPRMQGPKPGMGGLAAKRGLKPGGMKLSDATKPATEDEPKTETDSGSQFSKFANIIDTQKGTLNFKNKAVIHGGGIDFSSGTSFSISLDEVDTMDELGKGNYGTVFKVRHARPKMRRPGQGLRGNMLKHSLSESDTTNNGTNGASTTGLVMAMKEIRLELDDAKFAQIIMELDILHRCISPFIVDFYGAFFQEGSVYICMEFMDGGSIDKIYGDGIPEAVLKKITLSTIMGLKCLKDEHNIIHRDVKPTNILVNSRGQVKICDFGVSGNLVASIAKTNIGCQSYMAPERISGGGMAQAGAAGGSYSVQSDIWSLGLTIIECALGRYPYPPETYDNIFSQLQAIVDGDPPDLPSDRYSGTAQDFVKGCLNKIPKMRPTYAMLLRHGWLAPLMKPPTISEDEEAEKAAEAGLDTYTSDEPVPITADKEVAEWVKSAMERKRQGKMTIADKPALHAAPLDAVQSPIQEQKPNPGVRVDSPELVNHKVQGLDFASDVAQDSNEE